MAKLSPNAPCPCGGGAKYKKCCRPLHVGRRAETPEQLMRSRYSAYAIGLADYIVNTTDPAGSQWESDRKNWLDDIRMFSQTTIFHGLTILTIEMTSETEGFVSFKADLRQGEEDASFAEKSRFTRRDGSWLYVDGRAITR